MRKAQFITVCLRVFVFVVLTVISQAGGVIYLLSILLYPRLERFSPDTTVSVSLKILTFLFLYAGFSFLVIPPLASLGGRVPLPWNNVKNLRPHSLVTVVLNRNYVDRELRDLANEVAAKYTEKYPGSVVNYLDANFPFFDKFPMFPHWSHFDGRKLDLAFAYTEAKTGKPTNESPSFLGYGICEEPRDDEENMPAFCAERGYFQYSFLQKVVSQEKKKDFVFDEGRTKSLVQLLASDRRINKIFIEPHLKVRLKLASAKIRFHGCRAVRHDDHIHVQL